MAAGALDTERARALATDYERLNPRRLRQQIDAKLEALALADRRTGSHTKDTETAMVGR